MNFCFLKEVDKPCFLDVIYLLCVSEFGPSSFLSKVLCRFVTAPIRLYSLTYFPSFLVNATIPLHLLKVFFTWKLWYPTHICLLLCFMLYRRSLPGRFCKIKSFISKVTRLIQLFSKKPCKLLLVEAIKY